MKGLPMKRVITFETREREELLDITDEVGAVVAEYGKACDLCALYALGATAAIMIQENWDPNIREDVIECLRTIAPKGRWIHDRIDGNGDAHIKAGIIGPSEVIPVEDGKLLLSTWQNVFFCEFDGPRSSRKVVVTLI
jgi:secondary thiamine-phosphate synthase enzyme